MDICGPFIRRPVATSLLAAACLVLGAIAYALLPVSALPQVDFPTVSVSASIAGASPQTMASNVAMPLERQFSLIPGVTQMTSSNTLANTQIALQFELSRNIDAAAQDVQAAIDGASGLLPPTLNSPPSVRKANPADQPIIGLMMRSDTLPLTAVGAYFEDLVSPEISHVDGVGQVNFGGIQRPAVRIRIDPRRAAALGLDLEAVRAKVLANSVNAPKGQFTGPDDSTILYANDQVLEAAPWNDLVVGYQHGAPIRLRDIGQAVAGPENDQTGAFAAPGAGDAGGGFKAGPALIILVTKQPGANLMKTAEAIKARLAAIQARLPAAVELRVIQDRTWTVRAAVADVQRTLLISVALVVAVIFLFLRDWRATVIPAAVIPLSLLATAAVMLPLRYSLDNLSLMALTIAVGFVVDDAVVLVEAVWRRIEHGEKPFQAALNGASEVGFTVTSISLSLVAVFIPLLFMGGVIGRMMREFAVTLAAAVLLSLAFSLSVTPMLCSRLLRRPAATARGIAAGLELAFLRLERAYRRALQGVLRRPAATLAAFFICTGLSVALYATARTGFFPQQDTGVLGGALVAAQNASFAKTARKAQEAVRILAADPDVTEAHFIIGGNTSLASLNVSLRPKDKGRRSSPDEIIARLRPRLAALVGAQVFLQPVQDIQVGARPGLAQYQYTISDADTAELNDWGPRLLEALQTLPQLRDVNSDQQSAARSATLVIDRDAAARFGLSPADIDGAIYDQVGQRQVAQTFSQINYSRVIMEAPDALQASPALLDSLFIRSPTTGRTVPLSVMAHVDTSRLRSLSVNHQGLFPAITLSFNLAPGVSLGEATAAIERVRAELGAPAALMGAFQGAAEAFRDALSTMPVLILASLLSVYVVLGVLYESYVHPLTILSTLPSAGLGALAALRMAGRELDVIGVIALILLIGIVKKNGIMIVDVALKLEREEGMAPRDAVVQACRQRFRPILMTTACAFLGGLPMILEQGAGAELRQPLGWAICGGLLVSQALTLFSTPVVYLHLDRLRRSLGEAGPPSPPSTAPRPPSGRLRAFTARRPA